jgi:hypothetical protein
MTLNILFLGDVFGAPGRKALKTHLSALREKHAVTCVVANGENSASGRGITAETAQEIFAAGVDIITLGDHTFDQKGVEELLASNPRVIRPANYPAGTVGRGHTLFTTAEGKRIAVINLQGRVFMKQLIDCPFQASKELQQTYKLGDNCDAILLDMHCEATSEKCTMGYFWDGKASLVVGTHTHIPTSDAHIMPLGTAYQTDAGMCGDYNSSLGVSFPTVLPSFLGVIRTKFEGATGEATLSGVLVKIKADGLSEAVTPIRVGGILTPTA